MFNLIYLEFFMNFFVFIIIINIINSKQFLKDEKILNSNIRKLVDIDLETLRKQILQNHNYHRKRHQVDGLKRNFEIEKIAQNYSEYIVSKGGIKPSGNAYKNNTLGENIFYAWFSLDPVLNGTDISDGWYSQVNNYNFSNPDDTPIFKSFSQLVWKSTEEIGCGAACSSDNWCSVICNYYPSGNIEGQFASNVFPIIDLPDDNNDDDSGGMNTVGIVFLVFFIILIIVVVAFLIYRFLIKKGNGTPKLSLTSGDISLLPR